MAKLLIDIDHGSFDHKTVDHLRATAERSVNAAIGRADLEFPENAELSIMLGNDGQLRALNREWRNIDMSTNVLSFPGKDISVGEEAGPLIGDIAISMETLKREADLEKKSEDDHFSHLIVHGFLHLFGYDHETDDEADVMENLERSVLADLGIADPYESET